MEYIEEYDIWGGFIIAIIAAFSTLAGALTSLYFKQVNQRTLSVILGFAAGIMLYTAFVKFLPDSMKILTTQLSYQTGTIAANFFFFFGILMLYPVGHLLHSKKDNGDLPREELHYRRLAVLLLIAIMAHSFVEGVATFLSYLSSPLVAIPLILSIIAHNFPEGMTIGALFNISTTTNLRKSVVYSILASLCEPIGAITAYFFILRYSNPVLMGGIKAFLAGLLVATALNELIPNSQLKGTRRISIQSIIAGMFFMALIIVIGTIW